MQTKQQEAEGRFELCDAKGSGERIKSESRLREVSSGLDVGPDLQCADTQIQGRMNSSECFNRGKGFVVALLLFAEMTVCGVFFLFLGFVLAGWETIEQTIEVFHDNRRSPKQD